MYFFQTRPLTRLALLFDTGCLVLIWLVQLVIYPSFKFYPPSDLRKWHNKYTKRVTYVVLPLMVGQLILTSMQATSFQLLALFKLLLVILTWLVTFAVFVPLHNKIEKTTDYSRITSSLVSKNWTRTVLWTVIFLITVFKNFTP